MKVSELIKLLSTYNQDSEVDLIGEPDDYGYWSASLWIDNKCILKEEGVAE